MNVFMQCCICIENNAEGVIQLNIVRIIIFPMFRYWNNVLLPNGCFIVPAWEATHLRSMVRMEVECYRPLYHAYA